MTGVFQQKFLFLCHTCFSDPITADDLDTDPFLGMHVEEPDSWTPAVGKEVGYATLQTW